MSTLNKRGYTILFSYLAGGWTLLEFLNFIIDRFYFSAYWSDIYLLYFFCLFPTILVIAFFSQKKKLKKILIPTNVLACVGLSVVLFIGKPLGSYANTVTIVDETGKEKPFRTIKDRYEIKLGVGGFINSDSIDSLQWFEYGLRPLLALDLEISEIFHIQDFWRNFSSSSHILEIIENSHYNDLDYIMMGSFEIDDDLLNVFFQIYDKEGQLITTDSVSNSDIYDLVDQISDKIMVNVQFSGELGTVRNFPLKSISTSSQQALKKYAQVVGRKYEIGPQSVFPRLYEAIEHDETFVQPYIELSERVALYDLDESKRLLEEALKFSTSLPKYEQLILLMRYYRLQEPERAIQLARDILKLYPNNYLKTREVAEVFRAMGLYDEQKQYVLNFYERLNHQDKLNFFTDAAYNKDFEMLELVNNEISDDPLNADWQERKLQLLYVQGNPRAIETHLKRMSTLFPDKKELLLDIHINPAEVSQPLLVGSFSVNGYYYINYSYEDGRNFWYSQYYNSKRPIYYVNNNEYYMTLGSRKQKVLYDDNGNKYGVSYAWSPKGTTRPEYYLPQDLIEFDDDLVSYNIDEIRSNVDKLILEFPKHWYLAKYKEALEYLETNPNVNPDIVGRYGNRLEVYMKDSVLYYSAPAKIYDFPLFALDSNRFMKEYIQMEFVTDSTGRTMIFRSYDTEKGVLFPTRRYKKRGTN